MHRPLLLLAGLGLGLSAVLVPATSAQAHPAHPARKACTTTIDTASIKLGPRPVAVLSEGYVRQTASFVVHDSCIEFDSGQISASVSYGDGIVDYFFSEPAQVDPEGDGNFDVYTNAYFGAPELGNEDIKTWGAQIQVYGSVAADASAPGFSVLRKGRLTTNATPEPVKKNHPLTVRGNLTRADLDGGSDQGFGHQTVQLQYRTKSGNYHNVKPVKSNASGALKTTVKAGKDGYYRYVFAGTASTSSVASASDYVDVT